MFSIGTLHFVFDQESEHSTLSGVCERGRRNRGRQSLENFRLTQKRVCDIDLDYNTLLQMEIQGKLKHRIAFKTKLVCNVVSVIQHDSNINGMITSRLMVFECLHILDRCDGSRPLWSPVARDVLVLVVKGGKWIGNLKLNVEIWTAGYKTQCS